MAARWGKTTTKEGEEVRLIAQVKDIGDGNVVTFQVWKRGQDPAVHIAQERITAEVSGGAAEAVWKARTVDLGDELPAEDPEYFFTVHSAWCPWKESGMLTVELRRPELSETDALFKGAEIMSETEERREEENVIKVEIDRDKLFEKPIKVFKAKNYQITVMETDYAENE
jgi:hypothetical protein